MLVYVHFDLQDRVFIISGGPSGARSLRSLRSSDAPGPPRRTGACASTNLLARLWRARGVPGAAEPRPANVAVFIIIVGRCPLSILGSFVGRSRRWRR